MKKLISIYKISLILLILSVIPFLIFWKGLLTDDGQIFGISMLIFFYIGLILFLMFLISFAFYLATRNKNIEKNNNSSKQFSYSFAAAIVTFFAVFSCILIPGNIVTGLIFAFSAGIGIDLGYRSILQKKSSDKLIGLIAILINGFLIIITIVSFYFDNF